MTKFRYWDPFNGCMAYSEKFKKMSEFFRNYELSLDGGNEPVLMQHIGIKSQGRDIYSGDWLRKFGTQRTGEVVFQEGCFCWGNTHQSVSFYMDDLVKIGNKFENPEIMAVEP